MGVRRDARFWARHFIEEDGNHFSMPVDRYVEMLDDHREFVIDGDDISRGDYVFRHLAYSTLVGAVRAAAREMSRYDADSDEVTPPPRGGSNG